MDKVELEIGSYQKKERRLREMAEKQDTFGDDLDNFMDMLNEDVEQLDKTEIKKLRVSSRDTKLL